MSDLTPEEQQNVRAALRFLRIRFGGLAQFAKALHACKTTAQGRNVSASVAFRVARLAGVGVDDVVGGKYPPAGVCPHCGHTMSERAA